MKLCCGMRSGRSAGYLVGGVLLAFALVGCSKPAADAPAATKSVSASETGQRVYLDPQTGKMRAPTAAEKAAAVEAEKQQQKTDASQQKAQIERLDRVEQTPGGGSIIHLGSEDWPQEKVQLDAAKQGDVQP